MFTGTVLFTCPHGTVPQFTHLVVFPDTLVVGTYPHPLLLLLVCSQAFLFHFCYFRPSSLTTLFPSTSQTDFFVILHLLWVGTCFVCSTLDACWQAHLLDYYHATIPHRHDRQAFMNFAPLFYQTPPSSHPTVCDIPITPTCCRRLP